LRLKAVGASSFKIRAIGVGWAAELALARRVRRVLDALELAGRLLAVVTGRCLVSALRISERAVLALVCRGIAQVSIRCLEAMLLAIGNVAKTLAGSGALMTRAARIIANKTSSAIIGLIHVGTLPWLIADVGTTSSLSSVGIHNAHVTPSTVGSDICGDI